MSLKKLTLFIAVGLAFFESSSFAALYECKNDSGRTIYLEQPCSKSVEVLAQVNDSPAFIQSNTKFEHKQNVVDIYVAEWCPYCKKALSYLKKIKLLSPYMTLRKMKKKKEKRKKTATITRFCRNTINGD